MKRVNHAFFLIARVEFHRVWQQGGVETGPQVLADLDPSPAARCMTVRVGQDKGFQAGLARPEPGKFGTDFGQFIGG